MRHNELSRSGLKRGNGGAHAHALRAVEDQRRKGLGRSEVLRGPGVLPSSTQTDGCLFASLLQGTIHGDDYISMTVWTERGSGRQVRARRSSSIGSWTSRTSSCRRLKSVSPTCMGRAMRWSSPGSNPRLKPGMSPEPPMKRCWRTSPEGHVFVRMVAARLRRGAFDEFQRRFDDEVRPALAATPGCLGAFLVAGAGDQTRVPLGDHVGAGGRRGEVWPQR